MLRSVSSLLIVLQLAAPAARAAAPGVEIARHTVWVKSRAALQTACGRTNAIRACTQVTAILVAGPCMAQADRWAMASPAIRASAVMILVASRQAFDDGSVRHENSHLADLRVSFDAYLAELAARRFAGEAECLAAGDAEARGFTSRMKDFESATNRNLHAQREDASGGR